MNTLLLGAIAVVFLGVVVVLFLVLHSRMDKWPKVKRLYNKLSYKVFFNVFHQAINTGAVPI